MKWLILGFWCMMVMQLGAQTDQNIDRNAMTFSIYKLSGLGPKIDGDLNDEAWNAAVQTSLAMTNFEPDPGKPQSNVTEIKMLYDDNALYLSAFLYQKREDILMELAQRDVINNTDFFGVLIDPYAGGTNGFGFYVNPRNLQIDVQYISLDEDISWDAIWASATKIKDDGWAVEMRIPYSMLRFPKGQVQNWNINFIRQIKKTREKATFMPKDPAVPGILNQMARLKGLENIDPPVRLSLFPYVTGYYTPESDKKASITGGLDLKYGLNDAYTLDLTLIPDFGQVTFDNTINNLGPFEVQYAERRPFFIEGVELFSRAGLFYSRRIGAENEYFTQNDLPENHIIIESKNRNSLINAFKLTGRNKKGFAVGVFNAIENRSFAKIRDLTTLEEKRIETNPLTNYNIVVLDKNLPNNSFFSLINTNVFRQGGARDANVTGAEWDFKDKSQLYQFRGSSAFSLVSPANSSDQTGHKYGFNVGKIGGNWLYGLQYEEIGRNFNPTDLGYINLTNFRSTIASLGYATYKPKGITNRISTWFNVQYDRMLQPNRFANFATEVGIFVLEKEFNAVELVLRAEPIVTFDYYDPRSPDFSRFYHYPTNVAISGLFSSDYRKSFALDINGFYRKWNEEGRNMVNVSMFPRYRFNDFFTLSGELGVDRLNRDVGFAAHADQSLDLNGIKPGDILFSIRDINTIEAVLQPILLINPTLNISLRIRNYWSYVHYNQLNVLAADGTLIPNNYKVEDFNQAPDRQFHFINFESRVTWRYAPGSDIIFAWNAGDANFNLTDDRYWRTYNRFGQYVKGNVLSLRFNYFLDFNVFRRQADKRAAK